MFTWICPQCGREVPPSENECPRCAETAKAPAAEPEAPAGPPPAQPPVVAAAAPAATPPVVVVKQGIPAWLVTVLVAFSLCAVGAAAYFYVLPSRQQSRLPQGIAFESPRPVSQPTGHHPLAKFVEFTGIRIIEDPNKKPRVQLLVVNHSTADIAGLEAKVSLRAAAAKAGAKPDDAPLAAFTVKVPSIGPYESREVTTQIDTKLRVYELPDWQFVRADFEITAP